MASRVAELERRGRLSPSTIRGYDGIARTRFVTYHRKRVGLIDWQTMIDDEAELASPKTVANAWGFVASALTAAGLPRPTVELPSRQPQDLPWLDADQIGRFLSAIRGDVAEVGALLALHSLRRSELLALTWAAVDDTTIHIRGATVFDKNNHLSDKAATKTDASRRDIPIMIPRLGELLQGGGPPGGKIVTLHPGTLYDHIQRSCDAVGLPRVGFHGLRRSFASLAYHLGMSELETMSLGGWSDWSTVRRIYIKLSAADRAKAANKMSAFYNDL